MATNESPRIIEILVSLGADWCSKHGDRHWNLHDRVQELGYDAFLALDEQSDLKRDIAVLEAESEAHPLRGFVRLVSLETGIERSDLESAARKEFDGRPDLVVKLKELDADGTTASLLAELYDGWPQVATGLFGATGAGSDSAKLSVPQRSLDPAAEVSLSTGTADVSIVPGFLGGAKLADVLGVHDTRREAFLRQLDRRRRSLGNDWHEVREPQSNSPKYLYRADSPQLRELAAKYQQPNSA